MMRIACGLPRAVLAGREEEAERGVRDMRIGRNRAESGE
jgi:hypothetical protein